MFVAFCHIRMGLGTMGIFKMELSKWVRHNGDYQNGAWHIGIINMGSSTMGIIKINPERRNMIYASTNEFNLAVVPNT